MTENPRFKIRRFVGGPLLTTCYALIVQGKETLIIDAPKNAWKSALAVAEEFEAPVSLVIATHGHWDHISDLSKLQELGIPVAGHPADNWLFNDPMAYRSDLPFQIDPVTLDKRLADGDRITIGGVTTQILHTPGHSPGCVCIWIDDEAVMFTGDTLLKGGAGYLERPECDEVALAASIRRLADFPAEARIYPGHGAPSTLGQEDWLDDAHDPELMISYWHAGQRRWKPPTKNDAA